jgi:hypothetical protein
MKPRISNRRRTAPTVSTVLARLCDIVDHNLPGLRTACIAAGVVGAGWHFGRSADLLFATGLLFHIAIWFEHWWLEQRPH